MIAGFAVLTSTHSTPLYIRASIVLVVEGFSFTEAYPCGIRYGSRLTLTAGQWTEVVHCFETPDQVIAKLTPRGPY